MKKLDRKITAFMQYQLSNPILDKIMMGFTFLGDYCLIWIIFTILMFMSGEKLFGNLMTSGMLIANAINNGAIKSLVRRKRPFEQYDDITIFIPEPYGSSFPSGHSATGFSCAFVLLYYDAFLGSLAMLLAGAIAFSRMYLRVHFFSDVLVGSLVGCLCSFAMMSMMIARGIL